jgi:hypothetical protein
MPLVVDCAAKVGFCHSAKKLFFSRVFSRAHPTARKAFVYRGCRKLKKEQKKSADILSRVSAEFSAKFLLKNQRFT